MHKKLQAAPLGGAERKNVKNQTSCSIVHPLPCHFSFLGTNTFSP